MLTLKRRGARTDPCATAFLKASQPAAFVERYEDKKNMNEENNSAFLI